MAWYDGLLKEAKEVGGTVGEIAKLGIVKHIAKQTGLGEEAKEGNRKGGNPQSAAVQIPPSANTNPAVHANSKRGGVRRSVVNVNGFNLGVWQLVGLGVVGLGVGYLLIGRSK